MKYSHVSIWRCRRLWTDIWAFDNSLTRVWTRIHCILRQLRHHCRCHSSSASVSERTLQRDVNRMWIRIWEWQCGFEWELFTHTHTHTLWENKDTEFHTNRLWMGIGFVLMYHQMLWDICDITNILQCICVHGWESQDVEKDMCAIQKDNTPHIYMFITNRHNNLIRVYLQKYNRMFPIKMTSY